MALFIESVNRGKKETWHIGEPFPAWAKEARVLRLQADGDELDWLLDRLQGCVDIASNL